MFQKDFYRSDDIENQCRLLLGATLVVGDVSAKIVEVEGYRARDDKACHAYTKRTQRNSVMFEEGGVAYPYLCYGIHTLFNVVTGEHGHANAILIRAVEPISGIEKMRKRRQGITKDLQLTNGPGKVSQAMNISLNDYGRELFSPDFCILRPNFREKIFLQGRRIGIDYAGEDKDLPWRFALDNPNVSFLKKIKEESQSQYWL